MSPVRVAPSAVAVGDLVPVIGSSVPGRVLSATPGGWSTVWQCPTTRIAVDGLPEPLVQPEAVPVEVWR